MVNFFREDSVVEGIPQYEYQSVYELLPICWVLQERHQRLHFNQDSLVVKGKDHLPKKVFAHEGEHFRRDLMKTENMRLFCLELQTSIDIICFRF